MSRLILIQAVLLLFLFFIRFLILCESKTAFTLSLYALNDRHCNA